MESFLAVVIFTSAVFGELGSSLPNESTPTSSLLSDLKKAEHSKKPINNAPTVVTASALQNDKPAGKHQTLEQLGESKNAEREHNKNHVHNQSEKHKNHKQELQHDLLGPYGIPLYVLPEGKGKRGYSGAVKSDAPEKRNTLLDCAMFAK